MANIDLTNAVTIMMVGVGLVVVLHAAWYVSVEYAKARTRRILAQHGQRRDRN